MELNEIVNVFVGVGTYLATVISIILGIKYAVNNLRDGLRRSEVQISNVSRKLDQVQTTLGVIQVNAARHDQRAQDIQEKVNSIDARVTHLERTA